MRAAAFELHVRQDIGDTLSFHQTPPKGAAMTGPGLKHRRVESREVHGFPDQWNTEDMER